VTNHDRPQAAPKVVGRARFDAALAEQVAAEKEVTRHNDRVSASRRRLPMVEVEDYTSTGSNGAVRLTGLFAGKYLLLVQNVMFAPEWDEGCASCTWAVDNLPANMLKDGTPYLTYMTTARGGEATLPVLNIMDRTVYGRQQDWEDSPEGWPQYPTYG
jgi:predicted dithiol-disulfide oxidoreductase (DUF899 family)